jgi:hypothetical protein
MARRALLAAKKDTLHENAQEGLYKARRKGGPPKINENKQWKRALTETYRKGTGREREMKEDRKQESAEEYKEAAME